MTSKAVESRLKRLLELRTDSPAMLEALSALASVSVEGAGGVESRRRNLRSEVERRNLGVIADFIAHLTPMEHRLEALDASIGVLAGACEAARSRIDQSEADTAAFLSAAESLARQRDAADAHLADVTAFLTQYELRDDEAAALTAGPAAEDDGARFFAALARVGDIRAKSLGLITGRDQALGLELLEAATQQQVCVCVCRVSLGLQWKALAPLLRRRRDVAVMQLTGLISHPAAQACIYSCSPFSWCVRVCFAQSLALDRLFAWASEICRDAEQLAGGVLADVSAEEAASGAANGRPRVSLFRALRRALAVLHEHRPPYFRGCQDAVVASRRAAFVRQFVLALSSGGGAQSSSSSAAATPQGSPGGRACKEEGGAGGAMRAINLHAHDPLRYVSDMLAWVHLNVAEEEALLRSLFATAAGAAPPALDSADGASSPAALALPVLAPLPPPAPGTTPSLTAAAMLASVSESVARPLSVRVDQVVAAQSVSPLFSSSSSSYAGGGGLASGAAPPHGGGGGVLTAPLTCYRILDVLSFYCTTLRGLLPPDASLLLALAACHAGAVARFRALLVATGARIRSAPPAYPSDLTATPHVSDAAGQLGEMMRVYQASLSTAAESKMAAQQTQTQPQQPPVGGAPAPIRIDEVLDAVLEPLIESCRASADGLRIADTSVYMLNNLSALASALAPFPFTAGWVQRLASEVAAWEEGLVQQTANDLLSGCGLLQKLTAMTAAAAGVSATGPPLSTRPGLSPDELRPVAAAFYAELASPSLISLFDRVSAPRVRSRVRRDTAAVLAAAYARVYAEVGSPAAGYGGAVSDVLRQTPEQVEVLLDLR